MCKHWFIYLHVHVTYLWVKISISTTASIRARTYAGPPDIDRSGNENVGCTSHKKFLTNYEGLYYQRKSYLQLGTWWKQLLLHVTYRSQSGIAAAAARPCQNLYFIKCAPHPLCGLEWDGPRGRGRREALISLSKGIDYPHVAFHAHLEMRSFVRLPGPVSSIFLYVCFQREIGENTRGKKLPGCMAPHGTVCINTCMHHHVSVAPVSQKLRGLYPKLQSQHVHRHTELLICTLKLRWHAFFQYRIYLAICPRVIPW